MADPFRHVETGGVLGRAVRGRGTRALDAIENLLAAAPSVRDVEPSSVVAVCAEHGVDLENRYDRDRKQIYRRYLRHCFADKVLSDEENADLAHLRMILHLGAADVREVDDEVAIEVYGKAVEEVLEDLKLDDDEAVFLRRLREDLALGESEADQIYDRAALQARDKALSRATSRDEEFSRHRAPAGEFTGRSDASLEDAIADGLSKAAVAVPNLHWFEVKELAGYVEEGRPSSWHVRLVAGIDSDS